MPNETGPTQELSATSYHPDRSYSMYAVDGNPRFDAAGALSIGKTHFQVTKSGRDGDRDPGSLILQRYSIQPGGNVLMVGPWDLGSNWETVKRVTIDDSAWNYTGTEDYITQTFILGGTVNIKTITKDSFAAEVDSLVQNVDPKSQMIFKNIREVPPSVFDHQSLLEAMRPKHTENLDEDWDRLIREILAREGAENEKSGGTSNEEPCEAPMNEKGI